MGTYALKTILAVTPRCFIAQEETENQDITAGTGGDATAIHLNCRNENVVGGSRSWINRTALKEVQITIRRVSADLCSARFVSITDPFSEKGARLLSRTKSRFQTWGVLYNSETLSKLCQVASKRAPG